MVVFNTNRRLMVYNVPIQVTQYPALELGTVNRAGTGGIGFAFLNTNITPLARTAGSQKKKKKERASGIKAARRFLVAKRARVA